MINLKKFFSNYRFKIHNKKIFNQKYDTQKDKKILIEFNSFATTHIPMSYFSNILSEKYKAKIVATYNYHLLVNDFKSSPFIKLKWFLGKLIRFNYFGIYKSFGTSDFILPENNYQFIYERKKLIKQLKKKIKSKNDVLKIKIKSILIGDLIYDTYLKRFKKKTLEFDKNFFSFLEQFIDLYFYWENYFDNNNIKATVGHHTVYSYALPLRISIKRNIPTFAINCIEMYQLNKKNFSTNYQYGDYKKNFKKLSKEKQKKALALANKKLFDRVRGKVNLNEVDYISKSAFSPDLNYNIKKSKKDKIKVLIASHDFFDSVHVYGNLIFPDFYEWLRFIGQNTKKSKAEWYIKTHPDYQGKFNLSQNYSKKIVRDLVKEFPHLKLLNNNLSHSEIIKKGINFVFTCFGSIAWEYAFLNVIPITAAINNPYKNYKFAIHPKNEKEYKKIILNLENYKNFKLSKKDLNEYYYMHFYFNSKNFFINDYNEMIKSVGGYDGQFTYKLYEFWLKKFDYKDHLKRINIIRNFIDSKNYYFIQKKFK